jgi:hypothetical protein
MNVACGLRVLLIVAAPDPTALRWEVSGRQGLKLRSEFGDVRLAVKCCEVEV